MELRHMRYFVAVAEEGTLTGAAHRLGIQQPPLSQQIRKLECELGVSLFTRLPRGVELTASGRTFLRDARAILDDVARAAERAIRFTQGTEGRVAIGMTASAATHALAPAIVRAFRASYPAVEFKHEETNAAETTDALVKGRIDIGLIRTPVARPPGIAFHHLLDEQMLAIVPSNHPAVSGKLRIPATISLRSLRDDGFILVRRPGAPGMYADLLTACTRLGFAPRIAAEVDRMLTNISLVAAGYGVSAVPASMRGFHPDNVVYCTMRDAPRLKAPVTLLHRIDETNPAALHLIAMVKRIAAEFRDSARQR